MHPQDPRRQFSGNHVAWWLATVLLARANYLLSRATAGLWRAIYQGLTCRVGWLAKPRRRPLVSDPAAASPTTLNPVGLPARSHQFCRWERLLNATVVYDHVAPFARRAIPKRQQSPYPDPRQPHDVNPSFTL